MSYRSFAAKHLPRVETPKLKPDDPYLGRAFRIGHSLYKIVGRKISEDSIEYKLHTQESGEVLWTNLGWFYKSVIEANLKTNEIWLAG